MKTITHWIDGRPVESTSGRFGAVYDPATGAQEKQVAFASVDEVDAAVAAAKAAYERWGAASLARRTPVLFRYRELLDAHRDEIFGPVLCVVRTETYDEAIALINGSRRGNGTAIFTRDGGAARRFQLEVKAGMVGVNVPIPVPVGYHSFGGWKDSLFGDLHIYGNDGIAFCTQGKVITTRWPDPSDGGINLGFPSHS